jgi:hypothetical protein
MHYTELNSLPEKLNISGNWNCRSIFLDDFHLLPGLSQKINNHSPDGFSWGYQDSGPAQLALAILMHYLPVKDALDCYQLFKSTVVASWPQSDFDIIINLKEVIENICNELKLF